MGWRIIVVVAIGMPMTDGSTIMEMTMVEGRGDDGGVDGDDRWDVGCKLQ